MFSNKLIVVSVYQEPASYQEDEEDEEPEFKGPSSKDYDHGNISRQEAMKLLEDKREGTFLIRYSQEKESLILSRTPLRNGSKVTNIILYKGSQGDNFYFIRSRRFSTIEELVEHYQSVDMDHKYWLGDPLLTNQALGK